MAADESVFRLPDLGEGLQEAEIVAWQVGVGDHVVADQPLVTLETDKAVVEVPSPRSGRIAALHGAPGEILAVGAPLVTFAGGRAQDKGAIVGAVPGGDAEVSSDAVSRSAATGVPAVPVAPDAAVRDARVRASSAVRRRAVELGIDLASIRGSGPEGAIAMADLEAVAAAAPAESVVEPLRGVRRAMCQNMSRAGREPVRATVTDEADIHDWSDHADVTARLVRALVAGCRASPALNAWLDPVALTRTLHRRVDVGIALDTGEGLYTPVLRDAGAHAPGELRAMLDSLKRNALARSLSREALGGQTISLSNFGSLGGRFAELVVMPPQVAILGAGRAIERVVPVAGAPALRRMLPLSLSFDHRAVTGAEATQFLNAVIEDLRRRE